MHISNWQYYLLSSNRDFVTGEGRQELKKRIPQCYHLSLDSPRVGSVISRVRHSVHPFLDAKKEREAHSWGLKVVDGLFWIMIDFGFLAVIIRMQKIGPYGHGWSQTLQAWELKKHAENIKAIDRLSQTSARNRN
jgi:hypothetical protein